MADEAQEIIKEIKQNAILKANGLLLKSVKGKLQKLIQTINSLPDVSNVKDSELFSKVDELVNVLKEKNDPALYEKIDNLVTTIKDNKDGDLHEKVERLINAVNDKELLVPPFVDPVLHQKIDQLNQTIKSTRISKIEIPEPKMPDISLLRPIRDELQKITKGILEVANPKEPLPVKIEGGNVPQQTILTPTTQAGYATPSFQNENSSPKRALVDADNHAQVDVLSMPSVGTVDLSGDTTDLDTGAGTDNHDVVAIGLPASGGHVVGGTSTDPIRTDPTGTTTQPVSASSLPLPTGASTAALQSTGNTSLGTIAGAVSGTEMQVDVLTMPSIDTELEAAVVLSDAMGNLTVPRIGAAVLGWDGGNFKRIATFDDSDDHGLTNLQLAVASTMRVFDGSTWDRARGDSTNGLLVNLGTNNDVVDTAAETSLAVMDDWDNAASDGASVSGDVAHDIGDAGEPVKIGFKAFSPDGTTPGTAVAENDRTDGKADLDGRQLVNDEHPRWWSYHEDSSSALTDASVQADPGDGFQIVITSIIVSTGAATALNFFLEEGITKVFGPIYLEAVAGRGFVSGPIKKHITASTAVTITTSSAIAHSVDIQGYIQAV